MDDRMIFPKLTEKKAVLGAPALFEVTTRVSASNRATVNVRLSMPQTGLMVEADDRQLPVEGMAQVQFPLVMN